MIELKNVTFGYNSSLPPVLKDVSFKIESGQYVAILGHNGSGKSTLSKIMSALIKPNSGSVSVDGIEYSRENKKKIREKVGIIFQNPDSQFIGSTVEDDIAFGLENNQIPTIEMRSLVEKYAEKVGMIKFLDREPEFLSGGQKQRVAIASVLALNPEIIIFDEVTSMLDPKGKSMVLQIIKELQATRKKTLISITHDMDEAILADYCLVFSQGQLIAQGSPKEILSNNHIIELAKIDSPFIFKLSQKLNGVEPTYNEKELINQLCKLKLKN